ncbi:MAG: keto-deoxy-phosphogluconate aldolase [Bdellovibrio sp. 28-41-41]|nr:MAG: keto-deoxy-phosphogluconate aldolase [Bdellovibrio sp. 28-41-41]
MLENILKISPIVPVVTIKKVEDAVPIAKALLAGGIGVIEITLRTDAALKAIADVSKNVSGMTVGAGTISNPEQFKQATDAGAKFIVSPGLTTKLAQFAQTQKTAFLPGVATISEIMHARENGFSYLKFFPASLAGGAPAIKQFTSLFSDIQFCPTGGVNLENMNEYFSISKVVCIGGSWITPDSLIGTKNWSEIERLSAEAISKVKRSSI